MAVEAQDTLQDSAWNRAKGKPGAELLYPLMDNPALPNEVSPLVLRQSVREWVDFSTVHPGSATLPLPDGRFIWMEDRKQYPIPVSPPLLDEKGIRKPSDQAQLSGLFAVITEYIEERPPHLDEILQKLPAWQDALTWLRLTTSTILDEHPAGGKKLVALLQSESPEKIVAGVPTANPSAKPGGPMALDSPRTRRTGFAFYSTYCRLCYLLCFRGFRFTCSRKTHSHSWFSSCHLLHWSHVRTLTYRGSCGSYR